MTTTNLALYRILVKTPGVSEAEAVAAATFDASTLDQLATKADLALLTQDLLALENRLLKHITQTLVWVTGIFGLIVAIVVGLFRLLPGVQS